MSTSSIGSNQSSLILSWQSTVRVASAGRNANGDRDGSTNANAQGDSVTISQQGMLLLQAQQGGDTQNGGNHHRHQVTDEQAAQIGSKLQGKNPDLFRQLDQDGDGKLTADELKTGIDRLRQQTQSQPSTATAVGEGDNGAAGSQLDAIRKVFQDVLGVGMGHGHHRHHQVTDDQATKIGAKLQKDNPDLFKQLDQNGDGKLTADELKTGIEKLVQQSTANSADQPVDSSGSAELDAIRQAFKEVLVKGLV